MVRGDSSARPFMWALPALLLLAAFLPGAGSEGSDPHEDPWISLITMHGFMSMGAAWHVEAPVLGCLPVPSQLLPTNTCSSLHAPGVATRLPYTPADGVESIVVELDWTPVQPLGSSLALDTYCSDPANSTPRLRPCFHAVQGDGPLQIRIDADHWAAHGYEPAAQWMARVFPAPSLGTAALTGVDAGVVYQQTFTMYVSVFHHAPAPEGYTAIP